MIGGVAWTMEGSQSSTLSLEYLTMTDVVLVSCWLIFVELGVGHVGEQVRNSSYVVRVPVCENHFFDGSFLLLQC